MTKNNKGSALVWAISVVMVLVVVVAACLSFAFLSYDRSVNSKTQIQSQLTAQSAIEALVYQIETNTGDTNDTNDNWFLPTNVNDTIDDVKVTLPGVLTYQDNKVISTGTVDSVIIKRTEDNKITITLTASSLASASDDDKKITSKVKAILSKRTTNQWVLDKYDWGDNS